MVQNIYSIFDEKGQAFAPPFFYSHDGQAVRAFSDLANDPKSMVNRHNGDYKLYKLGTFDDVSGMLVSESQPKFIVNAASMVANKGE